MKKHVGKLWLVATILTVAPTFAITCNAQAAKETNRPAAEVRGIVTDTDGEPVIGAIIETLQSRRRAVTDIDGRFTIEAAQGDKLTVKCIGYNTEVVEVNGNDISIKLAEAVVSLDTDVVVTALGIKKEARSLSYNVQQIAGDAVTLVKDANFVNSLNGKVAGVQINASSSGVGGSARVVMRGAKSINGNNNVLYVVDGIPMHNLSSEQPEGIFAGAGQTGDALANINPDDIESISALTGPSAAALYGANAANGVVLITTKKGTAGRVDVSYTGSFQFSHPFVMHQFQNEYAPTEAGSYFCWGQKLATPSTYSPKDFFRTGKNFSQSASISVGSDKNQTYLSLGATNGGGIIHSNDFDRYNLSLRNTTSFMDSRLTLDLGYMLSTVKEQNMLSQGQYHNPLVPVYLFPAGDDFSKLGYFERYDTGRNFPVQYWPYNYDISMENPYWETERERFVNHKERHQLTASLNWVVTDWLDLTGRIKYDKSTEKYEEKFFASTNTLYASRYGHYGLTDAWSRQLFAEAFAKVNKYFCTDNSWNISGVVGTSFDRRDAESVGFRGHLKGTANLFTFANVETTNSTFKPFQQNPRSILESLYATAQLGYRSLAYIDLTARNDWSSKLYQTKDDLASRKAILGENAEGKSHHSYFYWSAGISGIWTDIFPSIQSHRWLNYLKTRLSYSVVGNEPNEPFLTRNYYDVNPSTGFAETGTVLYDDLKPEKTHSWEAGIDLVLFHNRLRVNTTLYYSKTFNQFFYPPMSASTGYTSAVVNGGRVDNKGIELSARYTQPLGKVQWETYLTWTLNRNSIKELLRDWRNPIDGQLYNLSELYMGGTSGYQIRLTEGGSMGDIYVSTLKTDEHGAIYVDPSTQNVEKNPNENKYYMYAGKATPNYNLSWGNTLSWKGLSLNVLFTYRNGGIVVSETQAILDYYGASKASQEARNNGGVLINGRPIPAQAYFQTVGNPQGTVDSRYVYSATNLRLQELAIGYDIPVNRWLSWVKGLNVSFVAHNLWMIYNHAPYDPEMTSNTGTYYQGIDYFMQPSLRSMGFAVKLRF